MHSNDPLRPSRVASATGSAGLDRGRDPSWELADVVEYNSATHTAVVRTHRGRPLRDVPQIKAGIGDFDHIKMGTTVVVSWDLGFPAILGCISFTGLPQTSLPSPSLTNVEGVGDDNPIQPVDGSNTYKTPSAPTDLTQGDWARVGTYGNHVAVLEGGVTLLGSPTAHVRSFGLAGVLQLVTQQLQTFTDFGQWRIENVEGRTSFILRAGSNQSTQTGLDEQHWTIRLDLGATGDLFNFEITEPQGRSLFKFHVSPDGRVQIYGDGGVDLSSGPHANAETLHDIAGKREANIVGDDTLVVGGSRKIEVGKDLLENVATDRKSIIGASETCFIAADQTLAVGGKVVEVIAGGAPQDASKDKAARTTKVVNGGWVVDIGNPADGANVAAQAGYTLKTNAGDISFKAGKNIDLAALQSVAIKANGPVKLDGAIVQVNGASHPLPKFDEFLRDLASYMNGVNTLLGSVISAQDFPSLIPLIVIALKTSFQLPYISTKAVNG